jgi:hypothetical protein
MPRAALTGGPTASRLLIGQAAGSGKRSLLIPAFAGITPGTPG